MSYNTRPSNPPGEISTLIRFPYNRVSGCWARSFRLPQADGFLVDWMGEVALRTLAAWHSQPKSNLRWYFPREWANQGTSPAEQREFRTQANWLIQYHFDDRSYREIGEASKPKLREAHIRRAVSRVAELIEFPIGWQ